MPALNNNLRKRHYLVFAIWLLFTLIAAVYFIKARLNHFDPNLTLSNINSQKIIDEVDHLEALKGIVLTDTIIHFTSEGCSCTQYSDEHKLSINRLASEINFKVVNINLSSNPSSQISEIIPSTPSILIVGEEQKLLYFGPYSVGLACSESNGYVETVIHNYIKGYHSDLVINDVKGCYCNI